VLTSSKYDASSQAPWDWCNDPHSEIVPIRRVRGRSGVAGARNHCVHGKNQIIVEDMLDMHPYEYFSVSHVPVGFPTALFMIYHFQQVKENKTHFTITFKAKVPYAPGWFKNSFGCSFSIRRFSNFGDWRRPMN
jgi:hypothetical protein